LFFLHIVLSFGTEITGQTKIQQCYILTNSNALDRFLGYIVFAGRGHQKIIEVMMLIKITGESVKFIGSKYIPYKYKLTAVHIIPE